MVWRNLTIPSQGASEIYFYMTKIMFFSYVRIVSEIDEIYLMQSSEFTKSLYFRSNSNKSTAKNPQYTLIFFHLENLIL